MEDNLNIADKEEVDKILETTYDKLDNNPPKSEVRNHIRIYFALGLEEDKIEEVIHQTFSVREEILSEIEVGPTEIRVTDMKNNNKSDWD